MNNSSVKLILSISFIGLTYLWNMEWAVIAPVMVIVLYMLRDKPVWRFIFYELIVICYVLTTMGGITAIINNWAFLLAVQIPIFVITFFYNGQKGKHPVFSKYFFYIFYPAHMILIYFVRILAR